MKNRRFCSLARLRTQCRIPMSGNVFAALASVSTVCFFWIKPEAEGGWPLAGLGGFHNPAGGKTAADFFSRQGNNCVATNNSFAARTRLRAGSIGKYCLPWRLPTSARS